MIDKALAEISEDIFRCYRCGDCREMWRYITGTYGSCPVREELRHEHYCGRGRTAVARAILENKLSYDESVADLAYSDLCCWHCTEVCTLLEGYKIRVPLITRLFREDLVKLGLGPPEALKRLASNVRKSGNRFGQMTQRRAWCSGINISPKAEVLLFVGCNASYIYTDIAKAAAATLKKAGVDFTLLSDEHCCGVTQIWDGQKQIAEELANHNVRAISDAGANVVVTTCAECYHTIKFDYPELTGDKLGFEVLHISEFLSDLIEKSKIKFREFRKKVVYHDPCQLGRGSNIYEQPRKILSAIPGVEMLEMKRNRANSWCCGSGAGQVVRLANPQLAMNIAKDRLQEANNTQAQTLVTSCPFCLTLLSAAKRSMDKVDIELSDLITFVSQTLE